jgi:flagellar hook-associated protein 3 FlgL
MTTISTSSLFDSSIYNLNKLTASTNKLQQQISTSNKLTHSYDDPVAAAQMRTMQAADTLSATDTTNTNAAKTSLTQTDSTLTQFTTILSSIQTLATQAASDTYSAADKVNIGTQISAYYQNLVDLANTRDAYGHSLFSGTASGAAYTQDASGNATYAGSGTVAPVSLGGSLSVSPAITGPEFLNFTTNGTSGNLLTSVKTLADQLTAGTATSATMNATGGTFDQLNAALDQVSTAQTVVGARLSWISTASDIQTATNTQRATTEASVGGTDLTTALSQLSQQMLVLQASQASFSKLSSLTLLSAL